MKKMLKKIWNIVTSLLVLMLCLIAAIIVIPRLMGMDMYVVLSGSMEPTYPTGSIICVKEVDETELAVGDAITFQLNANTVATHRIVEVVKENNQVAFRTKGDANEVEDPGLVEAKNVIGVPELSIPYLGYVVTYIQQPPGMYVGIALVISVVLMVILSDLLFEDEENKKVETEAIQ